MADEQHLRSGENADVEVKDRGLFDFLGKKEEEHHEGGKFQAEVTAAEFEKVEGVVKCGQGEEEVLATEFEKVQVTEAVVEKEEEGEKKEGLLEKLHRSHSTSSSSSSDEEEAAEGEGEKKRKKKSLKDKIKEKISGESKKEGEEEEHNKAEKVEAEAAAVVAEDNTIPVEKIDELPQPDQSPEAQEKKSLLDKIKEKLPGGGKKPAEEGAPAAEPCPDQGKEHQHHEGDSPKEKKGFLGKIMDKIPGYHKNNGGAEESGTAAQ